MIGIPAIDLRGGKVIRLKYGDPANQTTYGDDPVAMAERFASAGAELIHVVDLDAALSDGDNREVVRAICAAVDVPVQTGGGLRDLAAVEAVLEAGASRAVLGSAALDPAVLGEAVARFGEAIVVALDVRGREVMIKGWTQGAGPIAELLPRLAAQGAPRFLCTQINVDGTMDGPDLALYREAIAASTAPVIASGGVHQASDLPALAATGVEGIVIGKAIYEGTISLAEVVGAP